jgi:hypothetical protein
MKYPCLARRLLFFLSLLIIAGPGRAQSFGPPVPTELVLVLLKRDANVRFTLSAFYTAWENPFQVTASVRSDLLNRRVTQTFKLFPSTPASPLFEGTYVLNRHWGVGFWYNPIRGERLQQTVGVAEKFVALDLERNTDLADFHVMYYGPRGLAAQLGYYHESGTIHDRGPNPAPDRDYTLNSFNAWLTQRLDVFFRDRLTSDRLDAHLVPFVSAGYHPASGLNHAASVLTGVALTFSEKISLSGSVWLFDVGGNTATRVTGGVVIQW